MNFTETNLAENCRLNFCPEEAQENKHLLLKFSQATKAFSRIQLMMLGCDKVLNSLCFQVYHQNHYIHLEIVLCRIMCIYMEPKVGLGE